MILFWWFNRFLKWHTALNVVAQIQQLVIHKAVKPKNVEDMRNASIRLVKLAQRDVFKDEMQKFKQGKFPNSHPLFQYDPVLQMVFAGWEGD